MPKEYEATFVGENGSMGLSKNAIYNIDIQAEKFSANTHIIIFVELPLNLSPLKIPYSNIETFLQNWDKIYKKQK
jgi:hypothetical protein